MISPTQRTLASLRENGYLADVVERWIQGANIRRDFLGFADIIAIRGPATLAVQACAATDVARRVAKVCATPAARAWLAGGRTITVIGWKKYAKAENGRHWRPIVRHVTVADMVAD